MKEAFFGPQHPPTQGFYLPLTQVPFYENAAFSLFLSEAKLEATSEFLTTSILHYAQVVLSFLALVFISLFNTGQRAV